MSVVLRSLRVGVVIALGEGILSAPQRRDEIDPTTAPKWVSAQRLSRLVHHHGPRSSDKPVVLIADDVQDARDIYAAYLEARGFRAATACDGEEAVALTISLRPDVVVMDLAMPRLDGIGATRRLKNDPRTAAIPIALLTGYPERAIHEGALEAGATVFLTKPCLPEDLESAVRRLIPRPEPSTDRS